MVEPFASLLIREATILARDLARVSRDVHSIELLLREHLRPDLKYDTVAPNKGRSGAETVESPLETRSQPSLDFGSGSTKDYD